VQNACHKVKTPSLILHHVLKKWVAKELQLLLNWIAYLYKISPYSVKKIRYLPDCANGR
jgi:hypothetical protein